MPAKPKTVSAQQSVLEHIAKHPDGIKVTELTDLVLKDRRVTGLVGKTPKATVGAIIYTLAKKGRIHKLDRGLVRPLATTPVAAAKQRRTRNTSS